MAPWSLDVKTWLYRLYNATGELLYIGITAQLIRDRMREHRRDKAWWPEAASMILVRYENWGEADDAETRAIEREQPKHNIAKTPRAGLAIMQGHNRSYQKRMAERHAAIARRDRMEWWGPRGGGG